MLAIAFSDRNERLMHDDNVKKAAWSVLVLAGKAAHQKERGVRAG